MGPSPHRDSPDLDAVLDAVPMLVVVVDRATQHVVRVNRAALRALDSAVEQVVGASWWELVDEQTAPVMRAAMSAGTSMGLESTISVGSGPRRRVLWTVGRALESTAITADHVVLTGLDVTTNGAPQGLFSQVVRGKSTPMVIGTDLRGRVTLFNSAAEQVLGRSASELVGRLLPVQLFEHSEITERANRLGVPADLSLFTQDLSALDRRRADVDLGALDRRQRHSGGPEDRRGGGAGERRDRRSGSAADRRSGSPADRRGSQPQPRDWTLIRSDGARITASVTITKVADGATGHVGYLAIAEDVTEQRRTRNLLVAGLEKEAEAVRRLRELDRARTDFVATVSHELRTPITSILGYVEILLDAVADQEPSVHQDMLEAVRRNGERMHSLAENLLALSSFEAGEFSMKVSSLDLRTVVHGAEQALRPFIAERRLATSFQLPPVPVVVQGDLAHLERVLLNLLSNALKFTEDGGRVDCVLSSRDGQAVLEVVDTGMGVPAAEQAKLFTRFFRSSIAEKRAIQGTGIGLSVVDAIVRRHGGTIEVDTEEGRGTAMLVRLPLHHEWPAGALSAAGEHSPSAGVLVDS